MVALRNVSNTILSNINLKKMKMSDSEKRGIFFRFTNDIYRMFVRKLRSRYTLLRVILSALKHIFKASIIIIVILVLRSLLYFKTRKDTKYTVNTDGFPVKFRMDKRNLKPPTFEFFCAPPPIDRVTGPVLRRSIQSWKLLSPKPKITFLGDGRGLKSLANEMNIALDSNIDISFLKRPLFGSLVHRVNQSKADIAVLINSDIMLFKDFIPALTKLYEKMPQFLATGARYDVKRFRPMDEKYSFDFAKKKGTLHNYGGMDFWAWTMNGPRLVEGSIPPFVFARGKYDNWFLHEVIKTRSRPVVDLSESVISLHVDHGYKKSLPLQSFEFKSFDQTRKTERLVSTAKNFWSSGKTSNFELFINIHLSLGSGSYKTGLGTPLHAPFKLISCFEDEGSCLVRRRLTGQCPCEYSSSVERTQVALEVDRNGRPITKSSIPVYDDAKSYEIPTRLTKQSFHKAHFGMPLTLLDALVTVSRNGTIMLTAVNFAYREIAMNWACQLRRIGVTNFLIAALDDDMYRYAIERGVAVYKEDTFSTLESTSVEGNENSDGFKKLTRMKTKVVTRILRLGFDVLWSDCDIVYFRNPIPYLNGFPGDILIQSNAPDEESANAVMRINSGFYYVRSSEKMIETMDNIITEENINPHLTEQPCFYRILCGKKGNFRHGNDLCIQNNVVARILPRKYFPNGITAKMWQKPPGTIAQRFPDAYILHNNWILGKGLKSQRMKTHGYQIFNADEDICAFKDFAVPSK